MTGLRIARATTLGVLFSLATAGGAALAADVDVPVLEAFPDVIQARMEMRERAQRNLPQPSSAQPYFFVLNNLRLWTPGQTVTVAFFGGDQALHARIAEVAMTWTRFGNISLDFGRNPQTGAYRTWDPADTAYSADIRVGFGSPGYWSHVGRDSIDRSVSPPGEASLNLSGFLDRLPGDWQTTVLHEFGHALGFEHEHQNPRGGCDSEFRWEDEPGGSKGVYTYLGGPPNFWPKWKVDFNLRQLPNSTAFLASRHDPDSIMHYSFPPWMFLRGTNSHCYTAENDALSAMDRTGISRAYPADPVAASLMIEQRLDDLKMLLSVDSLSGADRVFFMEQQKVLVDAAAASHE